LTKSRASIDSLIRTLRKCVTASPQNAPAESELA
jgi:hypothetical protein